MMSNGGWRRIGGALLLAAVLGLGACGGEQDGDQPHGRRIASLTPVDHVAPLSRALPAATVAYLRVPSAADWLFYPRRGGLNELKASPAHRKLTAEILAGIEANLLGLFGVPAASLAGRLIAEIRGPIEIALIASGQGIPVPGALLRTRLEGLDRAAFGALLDQVVAATGLAIAGPLDDQGHALVNAGLPLFVHFDEASGVLHLLSGTDASRPMLENYVSGQYEQTTRLGDFERTIDETGRHLAAWVDIQRWWPAVQLSLGPDQLSRLQALGLDQANSLWLGLSSRNGRAAALMRLEMPVVGVRNLFPAVRAPNQLELAGDVKWAGRVALPSQADLERIVNWLETLEPGSRARFDQLIAEATEYLGLDPRTVLDAYGPDVLLVSDAAGFYGAYGRGDQAAADAIAKTFVDRGWATTVARTMGSLAIDEIRLSGTALVDGELVAELPPPLPTLLPRIGGRSYVRSEGAYQLVANVPQVLADRGARERRPLAAWLADHDVSWDHALVAALSRSEDAPRDVYHAYLQLLSFIAAAVDVDIDLTAFPTAPNLGLRRAGRLGFQLDSTNDYLEARFVYETTPLEALLNTNIVTWYVAGIVAAVAIPAYQQYQVRASGGLAPGDSCVYANDGACDEPDICAPGTDVSDCGGSTGSAGGPDSCVFANDGECDEPISCPVGTDTTDCGSTAEPPGPDSCAFANDGECDEPTSCPIGTDTTDCEAFPPGPDSCPWANDGECDEPESCRVGTDTTDCSAAAGGN